MSNFKLRYRPDIDGLRAIAVLSVVIYHIAPKWLPSGFLGVDIFFVLSGYLITSIIHREMERGVFSFKEFYIRRMKRILPVFFVVLITGLLVGGYILMPGDSRQMVESAYASLIFLANRYFARQGGYFDVSSDEKLFQHIWSLSVEEQFYFVFPIFLLMIIKVAIFRKHILKILALGVIGLSLLAFFDLKKIGIYWDTYYLSHTRFGELLVGSFLSVYIQGDTIRPSKKVMNILSMILLLILVCCFFSDKVFVAPYFPGILALLPCGATALLIYYNQQKTWVSQWLSLKPIVWLGKISYSLYLWHWLVLAIMRYLYQESELPWEWNIIAIILMFSLSIFTYYLVENPIRKLNLSFKKNLLYFYIIPSGIVLIIAYFINNQKDIAVNLGYPTDICHDKIGANCLKGDITKQPKILCVGNSYMGHLNPWIDKVGKAEGWSAVVVSSDSFPFAFDWEGDKQDRYYKWKVQRDKFFIEHYKKYPIIIFHYGEHIAGFNDEFIKTLKRLRREGKEVYVITSTVRSTINVARDYNFRHKGLPYRNPKPRENSSEDILSFIPNDLGINKIDLRQDVPKDFYIDEKPILADVAHWNMYGAEKMAEIFLSKKKRLIKVEYLEQ